MIRFTVVCFVLSACLAPAAAQEPWATYRGNPQRTGNTDGKAGRGAEVAWVHKSKDHFIAAPVPIGDRLFVSGLAPSTSHFRLLTAPKAKERLDEVDAVPEAADGQLARASSAASSSSATACTRPTAPSSTASTRTTGLPLWQLPVPGNLVHLEGSPTVVGGKVYIGGGAAGVLCVDLDKRHARRQGDGRWPPSRRSIDAKLEGAAGEVRGGEEEGPRLRRAAERGPAAAGRRRSCVWQQGKDKWHVDAPVAVVGDKVLVASAFLDKEKVGDRALFCLDADDRQACCGRTPLSSTRGAARRCRRHGRRQRQHHRLRPQGAQGRQGLRRRLRPGRRQGEVAQGRSPAACSSCAALAGRAGGRHARPTARCGPSTWRPASAVDLRRQDRRSSPRSRSPATWSTPATCKGVVHAIDLKTGTAKWTLDLGSRPGDEGPRHDLRRPGRPRRPALRRHLQPRRRRTPAGRPSSCASARNSSP